MAAFSIGMNRAGRSDPSGPATTPHASSGWSRRAWATIASYVAVSMISTAPRYGDADTRLANCGVGPKCGQVLPAVVDLGADQLVVDLAYRGQLVLRQRVQPGCGDVAGHL